MPKKVSKKVIEDAVKKMTGSIKIYKLDEVPDFLRKIEFACSELEAAIRAEAGEDAVITGGQVIYGLLKLAEHPNVELDLCRFYSFMYNEADRSYREFCTIDDPKTLEEGELRGAKLMCPKGLDPETQCQVYQDNLKKRLANAKTIALSKDELGMVVKEHDDFPAAKTLKIIYRQAGD